MGIESRVGAMKRLNKENIQRKLEEIDAERAELLKEQLKLIQGGASAGSVMGKQGAKKINSGFTNGPEKKTMI